MFQKNVALAFHKQGRRKGGTLGATAPPMFGRTVNPYLDQGGRLCPPQYYKPPPNFSDLATALISFTGALLNIGFEKGVRT